MRSDWSVAPESATFWTITGALSTVEHVAFALETA